MHQHTDIIIILITFFSSFIQTKIYINEYKFLYFLCTKCILRFKIKGTTATKIITISSTSSSFHMQSMYIFM